MSWRVRYLSIDPQLYARVQALSWPPLLCRQCNSGISWQLHDDFPAIVSSCCVWAAQIPIKPGEDIRAMLAGSLPDLLVDPEA